MNVLAADYRHTRATEVLVVEALGDLVPAAIHDHLRDFGFAILSMPSNLRPEQAIEEIATVLNLGEPFVPALYRNTTSPGHTSRLFQIRYSEGGAHPAFEVRSGQPWHVDGTLEDIGRIRTTLLYCVRPATTGGRTQLINSVSAFHELRKIDPEAAEVLMHPAVLRRRATIPGQEQFKDGPCFAVDPAGGFITRFSDGPADGWFPPQGAADALERGLRFLRSEAIEDGRRRVSVRIGANQCLVFRNDLLSHGREEYSDDPAAPRHLVRALYERAPS